MKWFEIFENRVFNSDAFNKLTILCDVIYYDYPRCFIAKDDNNHFFAFLENYCSDNEVRWNVASVTISDINDVNNGEKPVQSLFLKKDNIYNVTFSDKDYKAIFVKINEYSKENEILGELFVKNFCDMDEVFDIHGLFRKAKIQNKSSLSFIVPGENNIRTGAIFSALKYLKYICSNLTNKLDIDDSIFSVQKGSTVLTFEFDDNYFINSEEFNTLNGVVELGNILSANDSQSLSAELNNLASAKKYLKFVDCIESKKIVDPKIVLSVPSKTKASVFKFSKENMSSKKEIIKEAKEIIETNGKVESRTINIEGYLKGIYTDKRAKFRFETLNKEIIEGSIDYSLIDMDDTFYVNHVLYKAKINVITTNIKNNENKIFKLVDLKKVETRHGFEQLNIL